MVNVCLAELAHLDNLGSLDNSGSLDNPDSHFVAATSCRRG